MKKTALLVLAMLLGAIATQAQTALDTIPYANTIEILPTDSEATIVAKAAHVVPTQRQLDALRREFIAFVHFGPNTFTRREWGTGFEDPKVFAPTAIDTDQWVRAMRDAGMKLVVLTVKHHDGFVIYQSRYTNHGIMSSPFDDGQADVLRNLAASCKKYGLELGVYLSPADLYQIENPEGLYGNGSVATERTIPRPVEGRPFADTRTFSFVVDDYNEYFLNQLFELLTEYGPIKEVWFDGAHPKSKGGQTYNDAAWKQLIRTLAPEAVIFGRTDVRWGGNEAGDTRKAEFNVIPFAANPDTMQRFADLTNQDLGSRGKLIGARYLHYQQPEIDTSIREGWFYRDDDTQRSRSADDVFDIYERTVGGNATFILNIPPNRDGQFSPRDVAVLEEVGRRIKDTYGTNLLAGRAQSVDALLDGSDSTFVALTEPLVIALSEPVKINRFSLSEPIALRGERIEELALDAFVDGDWQEIAHATNVGYKRILRFPTITTDSLRLRVLQSRLTPSIDMIGAYFYDAGAPDLAVKRLPGQMVAIAPRRAEFGWKQGEENPTELLTAGCEIHYTLDGSEPTLQSPLYTEPFAADNALVKATAWLNGRQGAVATEQLGYQLALTADCTDADEAAKAIDNNPSTAYTTSPRRALTVDLGSKRPIAGFAYTPPTGTDCGLVNAGTIEVSDNGRKWHKVMDFELGNLINDPSRRLMKLPATAHGRYVRFTPTGSSAADDITATIALLEIF